jgi:ComF family protein
MPHRLTAFDRSALLSALSSTLRSFARPAARSAVSSDRRSAHWSVRCSRWLFPPRCALCGEPCTGPDLCAGCRGDLPFLGRACLRCGEPLSTGSVCGACRREPPPMQRTLAPLHYAFPADWLLTELKFNARLWHGPLLAGLIAEAMTEAMSGTTDGAMTASEGEAPAGLPVPDVIIPVPLHRRRLAGRGYNQALEIARPLARGLGCRLADGLVLRVRATREQSSLTAPARRRNVAGAFRLQGPVVFDHALIVDDVVTTGATTREIAALLRGAGCGRVSVVAAARAAQRNR